MLRHAGVTGRKILSRGKLLCEGRDEHAHKKVRTESCVAGVKGKKLMRHWRERTLQTNADALGIGAVRFPSGVGMGNKYKRRSKGNLRFCLEYGERKP